MKSNINNKHPYVHPKTMKLQFHLCIYQCQDNGLCEYNGNYYDLQYKLPTNQNVKGRQFPCHLTKFLDYFGYLNESNYVDLSKTPVSKVKIVTAITDDHITETMPLLLSFKKYFPKETMIVYDLGLSKTTIKHLKSLKFIEYRKFNFSMYPPNVSIVKTYGFKFLVVSEVLKDYPSVMWVDACVRFKKKNFMERVNKLINCYKGKDENHKLREQLKIEKEKKKRNFPVVGLPEKPFSFPKYRRKGYDKELFKFNVQHCYKSNVLMHIPTFHGILASSHKKFFEFIPTNKSRYVPEKELQHGTGFVLFVRTKDTVQNIMKWAVLCSLTKNCIAPIPWSSCVGKFTSKNLFSKNHVCHRFDQTLLTVLLQNSNNYNNQNYATEMYDYAEFRGGIIKSWNTFDKFL
uniref:Calcineurin-like phosphoesterase domain-containing protein n=1 Tax=Strongyloides stercoralis TaxID=6248 RepID=A0AAF5I0M0_STRER